MKRIVLVDRAADSPTSIVKYILADSGIEISLLVVDNALQKNLFKNENRITQVVTVAEIEMFDLMKGLSFQVIQECRSAQLFVENALNRFDSDYNDRKYIYYRALSFWNLVFSSKKIDLIFINDLCHGLPYDGILKAMSYKYAIPFYTCNSIGVNTWARFIFDEYRHKLVKVYNDEYVDDVMNYLRNDKIDVLHLENYEDCTEDKKKGIFRRIKAEFKRRIYNFGGVLLLKVCKCISQRKIPEYPISSTSFKTNILIEIKCYLDALRIKHFLSKYESAVDVRDKYIFYALQFEPEGNTQARLTLESQLVVIKMLSECIPEGWMVYVKEHPHQYNVNTYFFQYYIHNINLFKTRQFYRQIINMKNVKIVKSSYTSQELVKNSQAVASLIGSVLLESTIMKKPILLFSEYHPLSADADVLNCFSYDECKDAIEKIKTGFIPSYNKILQTLDRFVCASLDDYIINRMRVIREALRD